MKQERHFLNNLGSKHSPVMNLTPAYVKLRKKIFDQNFTFEVIR